MDVEKVLLTGLDRFDGVLQEVRADDWDRPSTCAQWTARELVGHVLFVTGNASTLLRGGAPDYGAQVDLAATAGDDPVAAFRRLEPEAREALRDADLDAVMETPMGPMPVRKRLAFPAMDLHLHAWDLGRTFGVDVELPEEIARFVHEAIDPMPDEQVRSEGVFGPEVAAPDDATPTERLMAWTGREVR
ncbi:MAG TPA: TIGR03086 family metal-binding protein [Mycobacteriales bacterium]|nr:TIGR03086 family metal-binding protein [Mycobacteriales bacterium]